MARMSAHRPAPASESATWLDGPDEEQLASHRRRFCALLIDAAIVAAPVVIAVMAVGLTTDSSATAALVANGTLLLMLLHLPVTCGRAGPRNGQTLGKQALGIRVVTWEAVPVTFRRAARRYLLGTALIAIVTGGVYLLMDYSSGLVDPNRQTVHDKIASTFVVRAGVNQPAAAAAPAA